MSHSSRYPASIVVILVISCSYLLNMAQVALILRGNILCCVSTCRAFGGRLYVPLSLYLIEHLFSTRLLMCVMVLCS